jgi:hypothetical protein
MKEYVEHMVFFWDKEYKPLHAMVVFEAVFEPEL